MIIRRKHNGKFTIVPNEIFEKKELSIEAKGLLGYLLSRPPNWEIRHGQLQGMLRIGRDKLRRLLTELIAAGYIERDVDQPRDDGGNFTTFNYVVRDEPCGMSPMTDLPLRVHRRRKSRNGNNKEVIKTESNNTPSQLFPAEKACPPLLANQELSAMGTAAREAGCTFVYEGSKPFAAWCAFRGDGGIPLTDVVIEGGVGRRGIWMPTLYPPRHGGDASP